MTPDQARETLADHYADVAPNGPGLTVLDVVNEVMGRLADTTDNRGMVVELHVIVSFVLEVLRDHGVLDLEATS